MRGDAHHTAGCASLTWNRTDRDRKAWVRIAVGHAQCSIVSCTPIHCVLPRLRGRVRVNHAKFLLRETSLTLRSTRPVPAGVLGREAGRPIIGLAPQASCRHGRVTSNVRPRVNTVVATRGAARRTARLSPSSRQPRELNSRIQARAWRRRCGALRLLRTRQDHAAGRTSAHQGKDGRHCSQVGAQGVTRTTHHSARVWQQDHRSPLAARASATSKAVILVSLGSRGVDGRHCVRGLTLRSTRRPPTARQGREAAQHYHRPRGPGAPLVVARYLKR